MFAASTATAIASRLLLLRPAAPCRGLPFHSSLLSRHRPRSAVDASSAAAGGGGGGAAKEPPRTVFPGGFKRPEIQVPALVPLVGADEAFGSGDAVVRGVGIVVLDAGDEGGGHAYDAARARSRQRSGTVRAC